jgi:hypothetical protein
MKRIIYTLISITFLLGSCKDDIFERVPLNSISDADVWKDPTMLRAYLTDIYSRLPINAFRWAGLDTNTDIATTNKGNQTALTTGTMSRTNDPGIIAYWDYAIVRDLNVFLEKIVEAPISETLKVELEGEARTLRAMIYFEKQKRYGGVPLVDVVIDPFKEIDVEYKERSTEVAIADFIDAELAIATGLLKEDTKPQGKINKWTAYALKARANLWAGSIAKYGTVQLDGLVGIPAARANEFFQKASAAADAVISSGKYSLYNKHADKAENYRKLFLDEDNGEAILTMFFDGVNIAHSWDVYNAPVSFAAGRGSWDNPLLEYILGFENIDGSADQPNLGPEYLYDDGFGPFENKDPRLKASVFFQGDVWAGTNVIQSYEGLDPSPTPDPSAIISTWNFEYNGITTVGFDSRLNPFDDKSTRSGFMVKKYISEEAFVPGGQSDTDYMVFRLAEMYLTKAEAEFELGNLEPAATALNATRERAGISLVDPSTITLDHIRTERRSELAWEQHRWWDLRRWRIADQVLNTYVFQGLRTILHYETGKFYFLPLDAEPFSRVFRPEHYYNPITDNRINNNTELVENPLY